MSRRPRKKKFEEMTLPEKKRDFRRHLRTYLIMSIFFMALNLVTGFGGSWRTAWFIWPVLGWGLGVALQGLSIYGPLADDEDDHAQPTRREVEEDERFDLDRNRPDRQPRAEPLGRSGGHDYREEDLV